MLSASVKYIYMSNDIERIARMLTDDPHVFNEWDPHGDRPKPENSGLQHQHLDKFGNPVPPKKKRVAPPVDSSPALEPRRRGPPPAPPQQGLGSPSIMGNTTSRPPGAGPREGKSPDNCIIEAIADSCSDLISGL